jgi:radical SAM protein with 4Fe4S-binding SPASM domain
LTAAPPPPTHLQVEVTGACNLRCRMCLVRYTEPIGKREGAMSHDQFRELVEGLPDHQRLTLQGLGEPLLSPHLEEMVRFAAERGVSVGFNSNGTLLSRAVATRLVGSGLGWLHISLDGATAATYEDVRHGTTYEPRPGQFDRVVENLRQLVAARGDARLPVIKLVFVAMRRNVTELPDLVRLGASIGVDEVWVQNLSHDFSDTDPAGDYADMRAYAEAESVLGDGRAEALFDHAAALGPELGVRVRLPQHEERPAQNCTWPWDGAYVTHRGEVQPCCMVMGSDRTTMGALTEQTFSQIWEGPAYQEFRRRLASPDDPPEVCRGCAMYRGVF